MRLLTALLAASLAITADGRAQVLPFGEFKARDGRPGPGKAYKLDNTKGAALAARINAVASLTPIVVDYDHQTIHAITTGAKAPASGWIGKVEWLNGQGLFAQVDWTANAKALIDAKEYRYFSPVIEHDEDTGEVTGVLMGALVNYPALLGMQAVEAALAAQFAAPSHTPHARETATMTLLAQLLARIGLPAETTEAAALSAVGELKAAADAAKSRPAVPTALAGLLGIAPTADEAAALAAVTALQGSAATGLASAMQQVAALQGQVAGLLKANNDVEIERIADGAIADEKFFPSFRPELVKLGQTSVTALSSMVAAAPRIPGLNGQATSAAAAAAAAQGHPAAVAALSSAEAVKAAALMGIKPDAWAAAIKTPA